MLSSPIDVVIPTRSSNGFLRQLVEQIGATAGYPHRIVYTGADSSASANRNYGLAQTKGDAVIMIDDDIEFQPESTGWLWVSAEALSRPEVVMVSAQLFNPGGMFAYMTGLNDCGLKPQRDGETIVPSKKLLTACCGFKHMGLRFDEGFIGSGFEDVDFCNQLVKAKPDGLFLICHRDWAVHRNEQKNQQGRIWDFNRVHYEKKWGKI